MTKRNTLIILGLVLGGGILSALLSGNLFQAALFGGSSQTQSLADVFIPDDYQASPGETGDIQIKSASGWQNVVGFSFALSWDPAKATFVRRTDEGSVFLNQGFFVEQSGNPQNGTLTISMVKASAGISLSPNAVLDTIGFRLNQNAAPNDRVEFSLSNVVLVREDPANPKNLLTRTITAQSGAITVTENSNSGGNQTSSTSNTVALTAGQNISALLALQFTVQWNPQEAEFLRADLSSALSDRQFFFDAHEESPGIINVVAAGLTPVSFGSSDPLVNFQFDVADSLPIGSNVNFTFRNIEIATEALATNALPDQTKTLTVNAAGTLELIDVSPLSATSLELTFSDFIRDANLSGVTITPNLVRSGTTLRVDGKKITLENLNTQTPDTFYQVRIGRGIVGNVQGQIHPNFALGVFHGFPSASTVSGFRINSAQASSDTQILLTFSENVNGGSIEVADFTIPGLTVANAQIQQNATQILLTTSSQAVLSADALLAIANVSSQHDLKSTNGNLLSQNVIPVIAFGKGDANAPRLTNTEFKNGGLTLTFNRAITASSLTASDLTVTALNNGTNLIGGTPVISFSTDFKTATITPVNSTPGILYQTKIATGAIQAQNGVVNDAFGSTAVTFGQNTLSGTWDFALRSVNVLAVDTIEANFSDPLGGDITPLDLEIWHDINGVARNLTITSVTKNGSKLTIKTAAQEAGEAYFLLAKRGSIRNNQNQPLSAQNGLSFRGFGTTDPQVISITPNDVANDVARDITIEGANFRANSTVTVNGQNVTVKTQNVSNIVFSLPANFAIGNHEVKVLAPDGTITISPQRLTVHEAVQEFLVLSDQSFASPERVVNDGVMKTTLWVLVQDPRGVSDIDKVTADLRGFNASPAAPFTAGTIVDLQRWYSLEITVPSSVQINETTPYEIPVVAENKSGDVTRGTVRLFVVQQNQASNAPVIENIQANVPGIAPGSTTPFKITATISDADGVNDISSVIVDLSPIGLGPTLLNQIGANGSSTGGTGSTPSNICTAADYITEDWSTCTSGRQTRIVRVRQGVNCRDDGSTRPETERSCTASRTCTAADYDVGAFGACTNGTRSRTVQLRAGVTCNEDPNTRPAASESCTTSFWDMLLPTAAAQSGGISYFETENLTLPATVSEGNYKLNVTVSDRRGKVTKGTLDFRVARNAGGRISLDKQDIVFSPSKSMVKDGTTKYSITVKVESSRGGDSVNAVVADLSELELPPTPLTKGAVVGNTAYFSLNNLVVPPTAFLGFKVIEFTASDDQGATDEERVTVEVVNRLESPDGHDPEVLSNQGYMTPARVPNDGKTRFVVYTFVEDEDGSNDIAHVSLELGNKARFLGVTSTPFNPQENVDGTRNDPNNPSEDAPQNENIDLSRPCVTTDTIVCMFPSVNQGANGKWFYLPDVVIPPSTIIPTNGEPYVLRVVVTDKSGRSNEGTASIYLSNGNLPENGDATPQLKGAVATGTRLVEVLFSTPLPDQNKVRSDAFQIVSKNNVLDVLPITAVALSSNGKLVTLSTNSMVENEDYTLIVDPVKLAIASPTFSSNRADFRGYSSRLANASRGPNPLSATAVGTKEVSIKFSEALKFSSLADNGGRSFWIYPENDPNQNLPVIAARFGKDAKEVILTTSTQKSNQRYIVEVKRMENAYGVVQQTPKLLPFTGYAGSPEIYAQLWNQADFNRDGEVNFLDFTLFASVYGAQESNGPGDLNGDGRVDFADFTAFAALYGTLPPPPNTAENDSTENTNGLLTFPQGSTTSGQ